MSAPPRGPTGPTGWAPRRWRSILAAAPLVLGAPLGGQAVPVARLGAIEARNIGPAGMSGRVAAVAVTSTDPARIFVGSATGGLFRSRDGGVSWEPVFDDQPVLGIGAVAVFQGNPDIVWVGTGEGNPRNSAGVGDGVFKSEDGGDTWRRVGLRGSERIPRVLTHPSDPDVAYAGVMGPAWSDGERRGVYRTRDGGRTWERVLYVDERTGVADLVMDPSNPRKLFAALWDFRRQPWSFRSGGPGSGLYVTHDGGDNWQELGPEQGLPAGELGRIGLAIAPGDPRVVYALVEAERSELLRSDDGGRSFRTISDRPGIAPRPFYYADLRVDPANENRLYSLHSSLQVSEDQGRTFRTVVPSATLHGDVHELWIDPRDGRHLIVGEDGGIGITYDRGRHWRFVENLALAQFYHISLDDRVPFDVYGGLQDNGSWYGPSDVWESKGILNAHWRRVGGGDGFAVLDDPSDPRFGYSMSQGGALARFDRATGVRTAIQPVHPDGLRLRFNWNAALALDPHELGTLYLGSQFVHRTRDGGASWEIISPDLTTNDPAKQRQDESGGLTLDTTGAENYTSIIDISPSPLEAEVIWVGTDDGHVQLTRDGGGTWVRVDPSIPGAPAGGWVSDIEPSNHEAGTAYVVFDEHRRGDWATYAFRTKDYGASWERLQLGEGAGFAHVVEEDPHEPRLLFIGTEFGLHLSLDGGSSWQRWTHLPAVPVRDLEVHARDGDLVVATHGRAIWVLDDIRPLRALAADPMLSSRPVHLFDPPPAILHVTAEGIGYRSTGMAMWQGETRPYGALLSYWLADGGAQAPRLVVADADGRTVATMEGASGEGLHRLVWNLQADESADAAAGVPEGSEVLPGRYRITVLLGAERALATLDVRPDPRVPGPEIAAGRARLQARARAVAMTSTVEAARERIDQVLARLSALEPTLADDEAALWERAAALRESLRALRRRAFTGPECQGICGGTTLADPVRAAARRVADGEGTPTPLEDLLLAQAADALQRVLAEVNGMLTGEVPSFRAALRAAGYEPFPAVQPIRAGGGP